MTRQATIRAASLACALMLCLAHLPSLAADPAPSISSEKVQQTEPDVAGDSSFAGLGIHARAKTTRPRVDAFIQNDSRSELREAHLRLTTFGEDGKESFHVNLAWIGSVPEGQKRRVAMVEANYYGFPTLSLGAKSVKIEPIYAAFADGTSNGRRAAWAPTPAERTNIGALIDKSLAQDAAKSKAYSANLGRDKPSPPAVYAVSFFHAKPNVNPFDPADLAIAFGASNQTETPVKVYASRSTFYQSDLAPFFKVDIGIDREIPARQAFHGWIGVGSSRLGESYRKGLEKAAHGHGVNVEKSFADPSKPKVDDAAK